MVSSTMAAAGGTVPMRHSKVIVPGPGTHDVPGSFAQPPVSSKVPSTTCYSMSKDRDQVTPRRDKAGPGAYTPNFKAQANFKREPDYGFSRSKRDVVEALKESRTPGPETNPAGDVPTLKSEPSFSFCSNPRLINNRIPANGSIAQASLDPLGGGPHASKTGVPGPGSFDPKISVSSRVSSGPSVVMGARRAPFEKVHPNMPGPGSYTRSIDFPSVGSPVNQRFSSASRMLFDSPRKGVPEKGPAKGRTPGPGEYAAEARTAKGAGMLTESGPKWSMGGRHHTLDLVQGYC